MRTERTDGKDRRDRRAPPGRRAPALIAVVLLGLVSGLFAYRTGESAENARIQAAFERVAGERIAAVEARLLATIGSLHSLASFFNAINEPTAEKFQRFVRPLLDAYPGVQAFEWVPAVEAKNRAQVEAEAARRFPGFAIRQRDARGAMVAAPARDLYFPVAMVEPVHGNEKAVGFDLYSNPARRAAIDAAIETREPQATARITLVQETGDQFGFLVFFPVVDAGEKLRGLVLGVFRVGDVVARAALAQGEDGDLTLTIRDLAADAKQAQMYPSGAAGQGRPATAIATARTLQIGGRPWRVEAVATPAFVQRAGGWLPQALMVAWLFLFGNIAWLVDRRYAVEAEVVARTAEMRQARDEARDANRAKSDFLATMSHEIRTPLNGVVALADHLLDQDMPEEFRDSMKIIARSGDHLLHVINDILDYSKLEARKLEIETRPFALKKVLSGPVALFAPQAQAKGVALELRLAPGLPDQALGDPARLGQILLNLIANAVKFTDRGRIEVDVAAEAPESDGRRSFTFTIRDTGAGMSEETRAQLFTEFWQADTSISRRFGGTGLGLAISKRLAEQMGGSISVVSAEGLGSAFTLRLPMEASEFPQETVEEPESLPPPVRLEIPAPAPDTAATQDFAGRSILIAEDNPTNRAIAQTILARTGARIVEAHDGAEALTAASREVFDLILMDVHMPIMTGLEATRAIRALPPPYGKAPIVALTASAFQDDRDQCRAAGMDDFLAKPYRGGPLREIAAKAMSARAPAPPASPRLGAATAPHHDDPAFEYESFALLGAEVGAEDARLLLRDFMENASARLDLLEGAGGGSALEAVGREAHALKSSAAMMGLARLAAIARELEAAALRADAVDAEDLKTAARAAFDDARPFVAEILSAA